MGQGPGQALVGEWHDVLLGPAGESKRGQARQETQGLAQLGRSKNENEKEASPVSQSVSQGIRHGGSCRRGRVTEKAEIGVYTAAKMAMRLRSVGMGGIKVG